MDRSGLTVGGAGLARSGKLGLFYTIHLYGPKATLAVEFGGRAMVIHRDGSTSGGRVFALVLHGNHNDPGVFECT